MEVALAKDHVTHAVIGGHQAESFGISDDPAFYHMLSSTLYRDEKRAVIRETLCNGWDAHIEAGLQDICLEITLSPTKLVFKDFGLGIDDSLIKPVYGIYGASTKKKNDQVTGGFGLGCKAPFSYVDHFEVISCHNGEKAIYRMSRSSGAVMGKPSITPVVKNIPTDESGITVSFNIKPEDYARFDKLIRQITLLGNMKVKLNGTELPTLPFQDIKHNFIAVPADEFGQGSEHQIQVRYGHVVYPIELHESYTANYNAAQKFLQRISKQTTDSWHNKSGWVLILQAQPNTISVTPSRESLSMVDRTVETISALLTEFVKNSAESFDLETICLDLTQKSVNATWLIDKPIDLLKTEASFPNKKALDQYAAHYIFESKDVAGHYLRNKFPDWKTYYHRQMMMRLNAFAQSGFGNRGLIQSYRAEYIRRQAKYKKDTRDYSRSWVQSPFDQTADKWFAQKVIWPIHRKMRGHKILDPKRLGIWTKKHGMRTSWEPRFVSYQTFLDQGVSFGKLMSFLRGVIIVGHNREDMIYRAPNFPAFHHWFGEPRECLAYMVPRNKERSQAVVQFFRDIGYYVIDLTVRQKWETSDVLEPIAKEVTAAPRKKRLAGWPVLSELGPTLSITKLFAEDAERTTTPQAFVKLSPRNENLPGLAGFVNICNLAIYRLFGKQIGVIQTSTQQDKIMAAGALEGRQWIIRQLHKQFTTNQEVEQYFRNSCRYGIDAPERLNWQTLNLIDFICEDNDLRQKMGLVQQNWSQDVKDIALLFKSLNHWENIPELKEMIQLHKSWKMSEPLKDLLAKVTQRKLMTLIDSSSVVSALNPASRLSAKQRLLARQMLLIALKG